MAAVIPIFMPFIMNHIKLLVLSFGKRREDDLNAACCLLDVKSSYRCNFMLQAHRSDRKKMKI